MTRPSIAELQRIEQALPDVGWLDNISSVVALRNAAPVLLEIAAAALRYRAGMTRDEIETGRGEALDRALTKVAP
jgi:hypothetical protein